MFIQTGWSPLGSSELLLGIVKTPASDLLPGATLAHTRGRYPMIWFYTEGGVLSLKTLPIRKEAFEFHGHAGCHIETHTVNEELVEPAANGRLWQFKHSIFNCWVPVKNLIVSV